MRVLTRPLLQDWCMSRQSLPGGTQTLRLRAWSCWEGGGDRQGVGPTNGGLGEMKLCGSCGSCGRRLAARQCKDRTPVGNVGGRWLHRLPPSDMPHGLASTQQHNTCIDRW